MSVVNGPPHCVVKHYAFLHWCGRDREMWDDWKDWHDTEQHLVKEYNAKPAEERQRMEIEWRAAELWILSGRPEGRDNEFWRNAERQVLSPEPYITRVRTRAFELSMERPDAGPAENWEEAQRQVPY